ncbi:MAG TPA: hypothetical protein VM510_07790, partial [Caulifigura sp.]|nr:hypothetical protein [Caulifigura sp.]
MGPLIDSAARRIRRQANWLSIVLVAVVCWIGSDAPAAPPEPLRPASLDSQGSEVPAGWTAIDRTVFDAYAAAAGRGEAGPSAGGIEHCDYRLKLLPDGSISGEARGRFKLLGSPAYIAAGQPSFALTDLSVDEKPVVWGTDSHGLTLIHCPRQDASFSCRISQRGIRRGESIEFPLTWLTSIATQLELTIPAGQMVESSGLLKTSEIARADGSRTISFQAGARSSSVLRCLPEERSSSRPFGVELRQTVSASVTKVVIQSTIGLVSQSTGPAAAEIDVPAGFTLVKVTLADSERLILTPDSDGRIRVPLGELAAGQRVELRLGMERPANWNSPLDVPRVAPKNGVVLREEWILQVEKPLEITSVDAPSFVQTALQDESAREVWTFRGNDRNGSLTVTARAPAPEWSADCFIRGRQKGSRNEVLALIDLKSSRGPLYEFEIDIQKPWKLVSATSRDAAGATNPLSFSPVHETEGAVRYRVLLRNAVTPQSGVPITLTAATQVQAGPNQTLIGVVSPHGGAVQNFLVQTVDSLPPGVDSEVGPAVPVNSLRSAVRGSAFFDNLRLETLSIHRRIASPTGDRQAASQSPVFDPEKASAATPSDRDSAVALKDATAISELQTTLGGAGEPASHHAWFVFDRAVDVSDAVIRLGGEWTLLDIRCDGRLMRVLSIPGEIHFPKHSSAVREIEITWSSPASPESIQRRDSVHWPQLEASILRWTWKIDSPQERRVTAIDGPFEVEGGLSRPSLRERLLAPLGRTRNQPIFNPFLVDGWRELFWQPVRDTGSHSESAPVVAAGRHYPELTAVVSWSSQVLYWLGWVTLLGSMFLIAVLRRFKRRTFRLAAIITGLTATAAWLVPAPYGSMAGAAFCGSLFAFVLPRRLLLTVPAVALQPRSSIVRLAGASVILLAIVPDTASPVPPESPAITPNVLMSSDEMKVYVAEPIAKEIAEWQRRQSGPSYLIRDARYEISVDDSELASASLRFDVIVADPVATRSIQLPFEGLTLKGPDAATMNGLPVRLIPAADGSGVILPVPQLAGVVRAAELEVKLDATLRVLRSGSRREMAMALPRCIAAAATVKASDGTLFDFRSTARGAMERHESSVTTWLGSVTRWQARWRSEAAAQPASDATVTAGAQSVVLAESESLRIHTRLTVESPELPDPFAATRLSVRLPSQSLVSSVSGENLIRWRLHTEDAGITVLLDLAAPPIVGQQFDLEYELPIDLSSAITLPPIPLVANSVGGHQIAVIAPSTYRVEILSKPDPIAGLWSIEPAAASMSLRKDRGDPSPSAAADLERPQPLLLSLSRRPTGRSVELEQSLVPAAESIAWTGTARIETSIRPGFLYEFRVDPAIEIQAVTVLERDVERPSRFLRSGERLLL